MSAESGWASDSEIALLGRGSVAMGICPLLREISQRSAGSDAKNSWESGFGDDGWWVHAQNSRRFQGIMLQGPRSTALKRSELHPISCAITDPSSRISARVNIRTISGTNVAVHLPRLIRGIVGDIRPHRHR